MYSGPPIVPPKSFLLYSGRASPVPLSCQELALKKALRMYSKALP
jgi:hypothetical protein